MNLYESDRLLSEYLLFHFAPPELYLPWGKEVRAPVEAVGFPQRVVREMFRTLPAGARALDLGCAVGGASFELARRCEAVVGIDYSGRFIEAAKVLQVEGRLETAMREEGDLVTPVTVEVPPEIDRRRVTFERGDAMNLRQDLGCFEAVLAANLLCRLAEPERCLKRLPSLVTPGGSLVMTTPATWMEEFTPRPHWLGGIEREGVRQNTLEGIRAILEPTFRLERVQEIPFLIREHARKYQWTVAQASLWRRE